MKKSGVRTWGGCTKTRSNIGSHSSKMGKMGCVGGEGKGHTRHARSGRKPEETTGTGCKVKKKNDQAIEGNE